MQEDKKEKKIRNRGEEREETDKLAARDTEMITAERCLCSLMNKQDSLVSSPLLLAQAHITQAGSKPLFMQLLAPDACHNSWPCHATA